MICLAGEAGWGRLSPCSRREGPVRPSLVPATPIALFLREHADAWRALRTTGRNRRSGEAPGRVLSVLRSRGASFFRDLAPACGLDADQLRHAIGALVACGLATSDGFSGLRALVWAARGRPAQHDRRSNFAGRWTALVPATSRHHARRGVELQAWSLLRRYGVVFRRLLSRETNAATWRELARVYRRLEARGEIRSGRFVDRHVGRAVRASGRRRTAARGSAHAGAGTAGRHQRRRSVEPHGDRHRGRTGSSGRAEIVSSYRDGQPIAVFEGGRIRALVDLDPATTAEVARTIKGTRSALALA